MQINPTKSMNMWVVGNKGKKLKFTPKMGWFLKLVDENVNISWITFINGFRKLDKWCVTTIHEK